MAAVVASGVPLSATTAARVAEDLGNGNYTAAFKVKVSMSRQKIYMRGGVVGRTCWL